MRLNRLALLLAMTSALLSMAAAQTPPQPIFDMPDEYLSGQSLLSWSSRARMLDMVYTENGDLIYAFVERAAASGDDYLVVGRSEGPGHYEILTQEQNPYNTILSLSIAVPELAQGQDPDRDRVYVAVHFLSDLGFHGEHESIAIISGPSFQPWGGDRREVHELGVSAQPPVKRTDMHPVVACVPTQYRDFSDYVVELAFAYPSASAYLGSNIYRTQSDDYGSSLGTLRVVAGPDVSASAKPELQGSRYTRPAICADAFVARSVLAFEDRDAGVVRIMTGLQGGVPATLFGSTKGKLPNGTTVIESAPSVAAYDGIVMMTHKRWLPANGYAVSLELWGIDRYAPTAGWLTTLHPRTATPGDLSMRQNELHVAAQTYPDNAWPQLAQTRSWSGLLNGTGAWSPPLNDKITYTLQPQMAVTAGNVEPKQCVGYAEKDGHLRGPNQTWLLQAEQIWLNR